MEDPNLIATLIPIDDCKLAENAFCRKENKGRYLPPTQRSEEGLTISSREATPAEEKPDNGYCKYDSTHRLQLTFNKKPKDLTKGYSFGTDSKICDIVLGPRYAYRISGLHFCITFDNEEKRLILRDSSTNGMAVTYNGQAKEEVRHHFTWILDLEREEGEWEVEVHIRGLKFKVELASHKACEAEYAKKVETFLDNNRPNCPADSNRPNRPALPPIDGLGIYSHRTTAQPSQPLTPKQFPIYISERKVGSGAFGRVDKVINVSTGAIYARKEFYEPQWKKGKELRRLQKEDWLNEVMEENSHENTVQVVDSGEDPLPFIVMPYLPLGNLQEIHSASPIAKEETIDILLQALNVLKYLHSRGIVHRDLKPENILIESRSPLSIKLADIGLANDKPDLKTICGTPQYAAPEVCSGSRYTASVDLWSLGVIILEYGYGLPEAPKWRSGQHMSKKWGLAWCSCIVDHANVWESDALIDLLTTGMLRMRPKERLSADTCLMKAWDVGLFDHHSVDLENATPTRQTALQGEISSDDGSTAMLLDALWHTGEESLNHNGNSQTGCCTLDHTSKVLESHSLQAPSSQLGSFGTALGYLGGNVQSPADLLCPLEARSIYPGRSKRQRSPAVSSAHNSSDKTRIKRRPPEVHLTEVSVSHSFRISDQQLGHNGELDQFCKRYNTVLMLLTDLLGNKSQDVDIDDRTRTSIGKLSEHLAQLKIIRMRLTQNDLSGQAIIATSSDCQEIVLASLTPSEPMSSIADLAAHFLHMVQLQYPQPASISTVPIDNPSLQVCIITDDNHSQSWTDNSTYSHMSTSTA